MQLRISRTTFLESLGCCTIEINRVHIFAFGIIPEYCEKYAKPEDVGAAPEEKSSDEEELSEDDYDSSDEAVAGQADP
ncbi:hypothetical protein CK203_012867 [Vitis vinifera]|uniref:Uncharacterized protein n=1 Tax=Vitis vinifera TaxID=29760 RepID=A0A438EH49_VITVI|nr:hypothetical protein CK203_097685 [Vitis vinifera]RVX10080.1 hypothetical protein CK203_012867 [Vitis vinifera]